VSKFRPVIRTILDGEHRSNFRYFGRCDDLEVVGGICLGYHRRCRNCGIAQMPVQHSMEIVVAISFLISAAVLRGMWRYYRTARSSEDWPGIPGRLVKCELVERSDAATLPKH
jgi:hypothetical protein